jgi:hypothetical protein
LKSEPARTGRVETTQPIQTVNQTEPDAYTSAIQ